jgi:hypothetical protein
MSEPTKHTGSCHCGKVRYAVTIDLAKPVISCNCSMCGRAGTLLGFVPADQFELLSGQDVLREYKFNNHIIEHLFCSVCGIKSFARGVGRDGSPTAAINVRCIDGVDLDALNVQKFDGKSK